MLSSAQHLSPLPAALPPTAQPPLPGAGSVSGQSFAQFLNDQPDLLPPPAHTDPVPVKPDADNEASAAPHPAAATAPARRKEASATPPKSAAQAQGRAPEATDPAKRAAPPQAAEDDTDAATAPAEDDTDTKTAGLAEFTQLIGLVAPLQQAQPAQAAAAELSPVATDAQARSIKGTSTAHGARAGRAADLPDAAEGADGKPNASAADTDSTATAATERKPAETSARPADAPRAKAVELAADRAAATRSAGGDALQATAAKQAEAAPHAAAPTDAVTPSFAAVMAQALPTTAATSAAAPVTATGQVHAAIHSNAFAPELAASVSLLAVDGVQQAELQLNPADMGPVAVQIVVDGAQAQVSFHAVQAETRQALEQSLPDLAAALQGQGLTLSGGGVFQQAPRDAQGGGDGSRSDERGTRAGRGDRVAAATATPARTVTRQGTGLLDTFA